jgi:hypothetical protein
MAGELKALLLRPSDPLRAELHEVGVVVVDLEQAGLGLVPLTGRVRQALNERDSAPEPMSGFYELTRPVSAWAASLSSVTPIAYVEMEFHGGEGTHAAIGWADGKIAWGPRFTSNNQADCHEHYRLATGDEMAINGVLRWLGIRRGAAIDEFEAAGLTRLRWTDEWEAAAK